MRTPYFSWLKKSETNLAASAYAFCRSSFTMMWSNLSAYVISSAAFATRRSIASGESVARLTSLWRRTSTDGAWMNTDSARSPKYFLRLTPPFTSTSKIIASPLSQMRSTSDFRVP